MSEHPSPGVRLRSSHVSGPTAATSPQISESSDGRAPGRSSRARSRSRRAAVAARPLASRTSSRDRSRRRRRRRDDARPGPRRTRRTTKHSDRQLAPQPSPDVRLSSSHSSPLSRSVTAHRPVVWARVQHRRRGRRTARCRPRRRLAPPPIPVMPPAAGACVGGLGIPQARAAADRHQPKRRTSNQNDDRSI